MRQVRATEEEREREMLKRATKQHRSQAAQSEHTVEALAAQIEDMVSASVETSSLNKFTLIQWNASLMKICRKIKYHLGVVGRGCRLISSNNNNVVALSFFFISPCLQTGELDHAREKLSKSTREQISQQAEIRTLTV